MVKAINNVANTKTVPKAHDQHIDHIGIGCIV